jgi:8-oxo-dGTP diphosphatase
VRSTDEVRRGAPLSPRVAPAAKDGPRSPGLPVREIAVALIEDGPRIVVARRGDGQHLGGHDEFPGGHREPGESLEECAVREALEETGLEVRVVRRVATAEHVDERRRLELHFFECACVGARAIPPAALARHGARWIERARLGELDFPPANAALVRELAARPSAP